MRNTKSYSELIAIPSYEERYRYLKIGGQVGVETFGYDRYLNQILYTSKKWKRFRDGIIIRDNGCDMACEGHEVKVRLTVHHINPITVEDVINRSPKVFDPENVVCVSDNTHKAIHYSNEDLLMKVPVERRPYDTCPWR